VTLTPISEQITCQYLPVHLTENVPIFKSENVTMSIEDIQMPGYILSRKNSKTSNFFDELLAKNPTAECQTEIEHVLNIDKFSILMKMKFQNCAEIRDNCRPTIMELINNRNKRIYFGEENQISINLNVSVKNDFAYNLVFRYGIKKSDQKLTTEIVV